MKFLSVFRLLIASTIVIDCALHDERRLLERAWARTKANPSQSLVRTWLRCQYSLNGCEIGVYSQDNGCFPQAASHSKTSYIKCMSLLLCAIWSLKSAQEPSQTKIRLLHRSDAGWKGWMDMRSHAGDDLNLDIFCGGLDLKESLLAGKRKTLSQNGEGAYISYNWIRHVLLHTKEKFDKFHKQIFKIKKQISWIVFLNSPHG